MINNIKVSIIMATYNGKKDLIWEAIKSVINQTYKDFELIIINDDSTNDVENTILEFQKEDNRIIYIKNIKNIKQSNSRNKWINISKWKYIAIIDDDDIWSDKDKLSKQIKYMDNNPKCWICWTNMIIVNNNLEEIRKVRYNQSDNELRNDALRTNPMAHSSVVIRKEIIDKVWWYNNIYNLVEDYELILRIWKISNFHNIDSYSIKYRINPNSVSRKNKLKQKIKVFELMYKYRKEYPNYLKSMILRIWAWILPETIAIKFWKYLKPIIK